MITLRKAGRWLNRLLAAIGVITVLAICTPIVSWWAQAYAGSIEQPSSLWYNGRFSARQAVEPLGSESIGQRKGSISMGQQSPHCPA